MLLYEAAIWQLWCLYHSTVFAGTVSMGLILRWIWIDFKSLSHLLKSLIIPMLPGMRRFLYYVSILCIYMSIFKLYLNLLSLIFCSIWWWRVIGKFVSEMAQLFSAVFSSPSLCQLFRFFNSCVYLSYFCCCWSWALPW